MSRFYSNKENNKYLMISKFQMFLFISSDVPKYMKDEVSKTLAAIQKYEKENHNVHVMEIAVKKTEALANYFLHTKTSIVNDDLRVNYDKVVNAFNIALFQDDPISKEIYPLFKQQVSGEKQTLIKKYDEKVINYILENNDFKYYLSLINGQYNPSEYVVYENGKCVKKKLVDNSHQLRLIK